MSDRIGIGEDRKHSRVIANLPEANCGLDQDPTCPRPGVGLPGTVDGKHEELQVEIVISSLGGALGRLDDGLEAVRVAEVSRINGFFNQRGQGALDGSAALINLAEERHGHLGLTDFDREFAGMEEPPWSLGRSAELRRSPRRREGGVNGTAALGSLSGFLKFFGDILVWARDQCGSVPDTPVGLKFEDLSQGLVDAPALFNARTLTQSGADQRMTKPHGPFVEVDDRGLGCGLQNSDVGTIADDQTPGIDHLGEAFAVVQRRDQKQGLRIGGQICRTGGKSALKALGQRDQPG